jgi:Fuc2NAc and GlcNAc transferase
VAVGAINLCWLLPIALLVPVVSLDSLLGVLIAYALLVAAALWLKGRGAIGRMINLPSA